MRSPGTREPSRKKKVLSLEEMERLQELLNEVFGYITNLKAKHKLAESIQYPKIPSDLSESAVVHLRHKLFPGSLNARFAGRQADVIVEYPRTTKKVEVKATELHGFEAFGERDILADYLVWVHFGPFFRRGEGEVVVYCLENPSKAFPRPLKISIPRFLEITITHRLMKFSGKSLTDLIRKA